MGMSPAVCNTYAHIHRKQRTPRCHQHSQVTSVCTGRVWKKGELSCKILVDTFLSSMRSYPVVLQTEQMVSRVHNYGAYWGGSSWSGELILRCYEWHQPRLGLNLSTGLPHCWWEALNCPRQPQLFWTCCCSPLGLLGCLTLTVVSRGHMSSAIHIMRDRAERRSTVKRHLRIYFLKSNCCFYFYHENVYMLKIHASTFPPISAHTSVPVLPQANAEHG